MGEESKSEGAVIKGKFFRDGLRVNPFKKSVDGKTLLRILKEVKAMKERIEKREKGLT